MCKRNLNANILICDKVTGNNNVYHFNGVDNHIRFNKTQDNRLTSRDFCAVIRLSAVFSNNDPVGCDDYIQKDTEYDFALVYYDGRSTSCPVICSFSRTFNDTVEHATPISFSSHQINVNVLDGHVSINDTNATYVDLMLLVRPKNDQTMKWTRQTIERIYIQTT